MVMKHSAACLVALMLFSSVCEGQWRHFNRPSPRANPAPREPLPQPNPRAASDTQQTTQVSQPLTWQFPGPPQPETIPVGPSTPKTPVSPASVAVTCNETNAHVEVMEDLFGNGLLINPADLTLGNCGATAEDNVKNVLIFDVELQACGSTLSMTNDSIIYSFILTYNPDIIPNIPVVRSSSATVLVQCHYPRVQNVSSYPVNPYWSPFSAVRVAQEFLYFSMNLMTDNWEYLKADNQYSMGDMIRIQVSVMQYYHTPLRVFVDSCIATTSPDTTSSPSYVFIDQGCMLDGLLTGSTSQFMPRTADNKLQFELEAFQFEGAPSGIIYITCHLIATMASDPIDSDYRACSYINGWTEASGINSACSSCYSGGSLPPGSGSSAAGPGGPPGVGSGPTGYFSVGVGGASGSVNTVSGPTGSLSAVVPVTSSLGVGLGPTGYLPVGGQGPGSNYGPGTNVPTAAGGGSPVPGYVPGTNVPTAGGGGLPVPGYVPGTNVPTAGGGGLPVPGYVPGTNVPTAAGGGSPVPGYVPGTNVPTAGGGGGSPVPGYGPGPYVPTAGGGGGSPVPGYVPGTNVPTAGGGGSPAPGYVPGTNVPTAGGGGSPVPGYGPGPYVPTAGGFGSPVPGYGPGPYVPTAGGGGSPVPGYVPGPYVPTAGGGGVPGSGYGPGYGVSPGFGTYGPINTGPTVYLDVDVESPGPGAGFQVAPGAGLGATPLGSGFGVTGSFGNLGTRPHFPPFIKGRKARDVSNNERFEWEAEICMGPIRIQQRPV